MADIRTFLCVLTLLVTAVGASSQNKGGMENAARLQKEYDFGAAKAAWGAVLKSASTPQDRAEAEQRITECENGESMLELIYEPRVVTNITVPRDDFFLYYIGMSDRSWVAAPNGFVKESHPFCNAVYAPQDASFIAFSSPDGSLSWNVSVSSQEGQSWSAPRLLGEGCTSSGDEILPVISPDGKTIWFSSNGLFGIGGYDIYRCTWDERLGEWGEPENLGFPFSSPADDFLYFNTPDGRYSLFASNRDCPADSLTIYVLEFDNTRIHRRAESLDEIRRIAHLEGGSPSQMSAVPDSREEGVFNDGLSGRYADALERNRTTMEKISDLERRQKVSRSEYASLSDGSRRKELESVLLKQDMELISLQKNLGAVSAEIQSIEAEFLSRGRRPDPGSYGHPGGRLHGETSRIDFVRHSLDDSRQFTVEEPEKVFDYTFRVEDVSQFAEDGKLPEGLVYQIRLITLSKEGKESDFHGLSPIFERRSGSKYVYYAGLFTSYNEVVANLNTARKHGFKSAKVEAFNNGSAIDVRKARELEKKLGKDMRYRVVIGGYDSLPREIVSLIQENCSKDIAKSSEDGRSVYTIAPFTDRGQATSLAGLITAAGAEEVTVEPIK